MREIVFDTETTGLDCLNGDRLVEIGCVELFNHVPTGRTYHTYLNPRRNVHADALSVHGLSDEFLRNHRFFEDVAAEFCDFVADSPMVAHNAAFDRGFVNMELALCGRLHIEEHRFVDTLALAKRRHPNGHNSLDALCSRYGIDNSARVQHGALLDAIILAEVYLELLGGRQATFLLTSAVSGEAATREARPVPPRPRPLAPRLAAADLDAHRGLVAGLGDQPLWGRYRQPAATAATV